MRLSARAARRVSVRFREEGVQDPKGKHLEAKIARQTAVRHRIGHAPDDKAVMDGRTALCTSYFNGI
jgi:hypothetical protein